MGPSNGRLCRRFGWADGPESGSALFLIDDRSSVVMHRGRGETTERQAGLEAGLLLATIPNIATQLAKILSRDGKDDEAEAVRKQYLPAG